MRSIIGKSAMSKIDQVLRLDDVEEVLKSSFRTTALLELLASRHEFLTIGDITNALKIPQSSASALVKSLADTGYLRKDETHKKYQLSTRLAFLGASTLHSFPDLQSFTEKAVDLKEKLGETIVIATSIGIYSQYVFVSRIEGQDIGEHVMVGSMRPLMCSATGWAMLMQTDEEDIGKLMRATYAEVTDPYWIKTAKTAQTSISIAKEKGYAFSQGPSEEGTAGIAFPLEVNGSENVFSIAAAGRKDDLLKKQDKIVSYIKSVLF